LTIFLTNSLCASKGETLPFAVSTSIAPIKHFIQRVGGERVEVHQTIPTAANPVVYEPTISSMKKVSHSKLYFAIDVPFEHIWLKRFGAQNSHLKVVSLFEGIERTAITHDGVHNGHVHHSDDLDPHIWLAPHLVKKIVQKITSALIVLDPLGKTIYECNLALLLDEIERTDHTIKERLKEIPKEAKMMVYHPSWGYFADSYGLIQVPIELSGKSPKISQIRKFIHYVQKEKIKIIFVQKEFSNRAARMIANSTDSKVKEISALSENWSANLIDVAQSIKESYEASN
jgi:zinc transport system substrate-binding protein